MAHVIYENEVLSNKVNDILKTQVNLNSYMTIDHSLAENAGMKKVINVYSSTGTIEELSMGEGNSTSLEVSFTPVEYEVKTYQGKFAFYDEQEMTDPMVVDVGLNHSADYMVNTFVDKAIAEFEKATLAHTAGAWNFDVVVDAPVADNNGKLIGVQFSKGTGAGVDVHVSQTYTETLYRFTWKDVINWGRQLFES